jgi:integrase
MQSSRRSDGASFSDPERDILVLLLGIMCGMRVSEIAQIEVQDVLFPSGALRQEVSLRAAITKGCRQRCIYPTNKTLVEALDRYLAYRVRHKHSPWSAPAAPYAPPAVPPLYTLGSQAAWLPFSIHFWLSRFGG